MAALVTLLRRLLSFFPTLTVVILLSFLLLELVPGDPAIAVAGADASPDEIQETRVRLGLDRPTHERFSDYAKKVAVGDLGTSLHSSLPVSVPIRQRLPVTVSLTLLAMLFSVVVGITAGVVAGRSTGSLIDKTVTFLASLGIAIPHFWLGLVLITVFAGKFQWFPRSGYVPLSDDPFSWLMHMVLPAVALGAASAAELARQTRSSVADVLGQDFVRTATGKGLLPHAILGKHVLKNAAIPIVTVIGLQVNRIFGGAIVVEIVFNVNGLGQLLVNSVARRDFPMVQGVIVVSAIVVFLSNLAVDSSYRWLDPRVRQV